MKQYDPYLRTAGSSEEKVRDDGHKHGEGTLSISLAGREVGHTAAKRRMIAIGQPVTSVL